MQLYAVNFIPLLIAWIINFGSWSFIYYLEFL